MRAMATQQAVQVTFKSSFLALGRYATIFAVAAQFVLGRCHASAGVLMSQLPDAIVPFNAVRVRVLCRCRQGAGALRSVSHSSCRGGLMSFLVNRLATNCSASKPYRLLHCCRFAAKRACSEPYASGIISIQSEIHRQSLVSHLTQQSSEYDPHAPITFSRQIDALCRRFAQRSAWLLLERADSPCSMVRALRSLTRDFRVFLTAIILTQITAMIRG